jgi:hypothetical protein
MRLLFVQPNSIYHGSEKKITGNIGGTVLSSPFFFKRKLLSQSSDLTMDGAWALLCSLSTLVCIGDLNLLLGQANLIFLFPHGPRLLIYNEWDHLIMGYIDNFDNKILNKY